MDDRENIRSNTGADAATEFPLWRSADRIRALAKVVVFSRAGSAVPLPGSWPKKGRGW